MNTNQLEILEKEAGSCRKCKLWETRRNVVFGKGNPRAKIMFIGEAPGFNEDLKGIPFCGKAGGILDELLSSVNLTRDEIYITNILKCRPPGNRDPKPEEIEQCTGYLDKQIELINPEVMCCLGRYALDFMLEKFSFPKSDGISKVHGKMFSKESLFDQVNIIAFYHPAVATYDPGKLELLKKDFEILKGC